MAKHRWPGLQTFGIHLGVFDYEVKVVIGPQALALKYIEWFTKSETVPALDERRGGP